MAQPFETFLACVRPKFHSQHVNLDKLLSEKVRYYKTRPTYNNYIIANALFRGDFQRNWNNDFTAQILINTGMVKYFIQNDGVGDPPKMNKFKKYGAINANSVRICMASIVAIAHSPFYTGEYYSKLSPLWQQIAHKVRPTYRVVLRSAVDDLLGPAGILWRPIILPNGYKYLVNSESHVLDDISIMPWHSFPNVQIIRRALTTTPDLPSSGKSFRDAEVQTDELPAVVAATTKEAQVQTTDKLTKQPKQKTRSSRNREFMKVFNKMMERDIRRFTITDANNNGTLTRMNDESLASNQWFPVVSLKRSRSIEDLLAASETDERPEKRKVPSTTI